MIEYVLPVKWSDDAGLPELVAYLRRLSQRVDVTVVDGSRPDLFARHAEAFAGMVRHVAPDADLDFANGKVNGVTTGLRMARHEAVVIADDDVRYDDRALDRVAALLDTHDLVRPQNYFAPLPWQRPHSARSSRPSSDQRAGRTSLRAARNSARVAAPSA